MEALLLLLRWVHIFGAVILVGGLCFSRFALLPALADTEEGSREKLHESIRRKWLPWVILGITLLLVSGLTNFLLFNSTVKSQGWGDGQWMKQTNYHAIFGVKFLLALVVFYFTSGLVGRSSGTAWIRNDRARWQAQRCRERDGQRQGMGRRDHLSARRQTRTGRPELWCSSCTACRPA